MKVVGRENIPGGGYIAASNHPSNLDALFVALAIRRRIRFMGKSELFDGRWGWLLNRLGAFPVQRGVWDTDAFETAATVLKRGRVMSIFPEGGVHRERVPAKSGVGHIAHLAGATVLPVYLDGTRSLYTPWRWPKVRVVVGAPLRSRRTRSRRASARSRPRSASSTRSTRWPSPRSASRPADAPRAQTSDVSGARRARSRARRGRAGRRSRGRVRRRT